MARWAQNPPSEKRVIFVLSIVAVCVLVVVIERVFGWPDMLSMDPTQRPWKR